VTAKTKAKSEFWQQLIEEAEEAEQAANVAEGMVQDIRAAVRDAESEEDLRAVMRSLAEGSAQELLSIL